jgi:hypothetical protein
MEYLKGERERGKILANQKRPHQPLAPCGARGPHGTRGLVWPCGTRPPHGVAKAMAFGHACFSRAPLTFFDRIRASELRFRIHFWITNRDSLMHNEDYETLTKG